MEGKNQVTSSFTNDLFGSKDSSAGSSSSNSIFGPSSKVFGRESMGHQFFGKTQDPANYVWNAKSAAPGSKERGTEKQEKKESPFFYEEKVQPCHLCSSIYYGGQDIFTSAQNSAYSSTFKKDGGEDDAGSATRGNWWEGGLYY